MRIIPLYSYSNIHNRTIPENRDLSHWNAVHFEELQRCWLTIRAVETACSHRHSDTHEPGTAASHWFYSGLCQHIAMRSLHNVSRDHSLGSWMILDATVNAKLCQVMPRCAKCTPSSGCWANCGKLLSKYRAKCLSESPASLGDFAFFVTGRENPTLGCYFSCWGQAITISSRSTIFCTVSGILKYSKDQMYIALDLAPKCSMTFWAVEETLTLQPLAEWQYCKSMSFRQGTEGVCFVLFSSLNNATN